VRYYFIFLGLLALRKIVDQRRSARNVRCLERNGAISAERDRALWWMRVTHVAFFLLTPVEVVVLHRRFIPPLGIAMVVLFVLATLLREWAKRSLGRRWNSTVVVAPDLEPVTDGPYRFVRHPNYLAMSLELLAAGLMFSAFLSTALVAVLNLYAVLTRIRAEEEVLFQVPAYRRAMAGKARLVPGLY